VALPITVNVNNGYNNAYIYPMVYAENFHGGVSFSGIWWPFVFGVRCL